jgi:hypothetical protein
MRLRSVREEGRPLEVRAEGAAGGKARGFAAESSGRPRAEFRAALRAALRAPAALPASPRGAEAVARICATAIFAGAFCVVRLVMALP